MCRGGGVDKFLGPLLFLLGPISASIRSVLHPHLSITQGFLCQEAAVFMWAQWIPTQRLSTKSSGALSYVLLKVVCPTNMVTSSSLEVILLP